MTTTVEFKFEVDRIDYLSTSQLNNIINMHCEKCDTLILNLENIVYMDSSGIGFLFSIHKQMAAKSGSLLLQSVPRSILHILQLTKMDQVLTLTE
ncbi:MAG: STAS domain-containing protein [Planctomycetes bacterium]|nr:STAS domain-containing protein [Planctomycetota bacterium]